MEHERSQHHGTEHCRYHVVCCPKDRRKVVVPPIDARLKTRRVEETARWGQELIAWEGMPDQVQVLVGCDPQFGLHRVVKRRKGFCSHALRESCVARVMRCASHALREAFPAVTRRRPSLWTNSYFVAPPWAACHWRPASATSRGRKVADGHRSALGTLQTFH